MKKVAPFVISLLIGTIFLSSCKKDKTCTAVVTVVDSLGAPLSGVLIKVYSDKVSAETSVVSQILEEKTTGKGGRVEFEQPLPNILFMIVEKAGYTPLKPGIVSLRFIEGGTYYETVEMIPG